MNQILSTANNHKQKKSSGNDLLDMRKIIIVFSVLIIVFALVIVGAKIYGIVKENNKNNPSEILNKPLINIEKLEQNLCRIEINYDEGLNKVTYWWNNDTNIIEKNMNGSKEFKTTFELPEGDKNILHVKATGMDGSINEKNQEFVIGTVVEDPNKPKISWYHYSGTTKMDIIVSSEKGIQSLSYNWEGEDPTTEPGENQKELKITIDVKRGTNKLYITATDSEGNIGTKEGNIVGVLAPEMYYIIENRTLKISIKHDMGFKKVIIKINNQELIYDENNPQYSIETTDLNINADLEPGSVDVEVRVYTMEEPDKEYKEQKHADLPG